MFMNLDMKATDNASIEVIKSIRTEPEKRLMALINGAEPKNESEKKMLQEINDIKARGSITDNPSMWFYYPFPSNCTLSGIII
jgi:hypothetical protein